MPSSAEKVLLNGGKAKLIGQRPANSHKPKNRAKENNCQKKGFAIQFFCSTESVTSEPCKTAQLLYRDRVSQAPKDAEKCRSSSDNRGGLWFFLPRPGFHFTLPSAALSGAKCQNSSAFRFSPV